MIGPFIDEFFLHPNRFFLHLNKKFLYRNYPYMTTGWRCHPVNFFSNDNRMGVPSGSHFQIKMITGWNLSGSHNPNWKINLFPIWTMRTGWVSSDYHFDLEMRTGWHSHPVVIWKKINNRMEVSSDCHTRTFTVWNFFIRVQKEPIRVQEELVPFIMFGEFFLVLIHSIIS